MAKYDVVSVGGATLDIAFLSTAGRVINNKQNLLASRLLAFEYGAKMEVEKFYQTYGGGAANAAVNLAGLGLKVSALICVGQDDNGHKIAANFRQHKVKIDLLQSSSQEDTSFSFIIINRHSRERVIFSYRGANHALRLRQADWKALNSSRYIYVSSLSGENWQDNLKVIFSTRQPKIVWNPGEVQLHLGADKLKPFLKNTYLFCLNRDEAMELVKSSRKYQRARKSFMNNVHNLLVAIKSFGPELVLITDGTAGAYAFDGKKYYHQPIIKTQKRLDSTGVGDAFNSTVIFGLDKYQDLAKAMKLGVYNTASLVSEIGAQNGLLEAKDLKKIKI
ncbi:MAG TPA: PfkB family carbohydrate kinase [bacterium]|nr:PfkB family carbohydrate kinase [bacterium]HPT30102.1 PfkB family carbohydrate kinase [bacterium]